MKCVSVVDSITFVSMLCHSFQFYGLGFKHFWMVFPFRPLAFLSLYKSPGKTLSYWYRPHTSETALPLLFIHGIGIGLYPYVNFLAQINRIDPMLLDQRYGFLPASKDLKGHVGIIAIEIMPISFRVTHAMPSQDELVGEILAILKHHGWEKIVLATHSYGSVISTGLLRNEAASRILGPVVLIDPVSVLLHRPDVAYNFTCRKPKRANEHQLHYFASMDMGVAHTLARHFFWNECILWKKDLDNKQVTVVLSGRDLIVDTEAVGRYLMSEGDSLSTEWKNRPWEGEGLDLIWLDNLDHAQAFDAKSNYAALTRVIIEYSLRGAPLPRDNSRVTGSVL